MNRYLITSSHYTGEVELVFDTTGRLVRIDMQSTNMTVVQVDKFKERIPAVENLLEQRFSDTKVTIVQSEYEVTFEQFWKKYNKKINKLRGEQEWNKLSKAEQVCAFFGIDAYDKFLAQVKVRQKLDPENYLKRKSWENEWQ
jgi:hypothetical protein